MKHLQPLSNRLGPAGGSSLAQVKTQQLAREEEQKQRSKRIKGAIVLCEQLLLDQGYVNSLQALQQESGITLNQFCVADNIDLLSVLTEFEEFYEWKYQKKPKLFRNRNGQEDDIKVVTEGGEKVMVRKSKYTGGSSSAPPEGAPNPGYGVVDVNGEGGGGGDKKAKGGSAGGPNYKAKLASARAGGGGASKDPAKTKKNSGEEENAMDFGLSGQKVQMNEVADGGGNGDAEEEEGEVSFYGRALKPLPVFPTQEMADLAQNIMRDILNTNPAVRWKDIAELDQAKHLLKEAVVMPVKYPELFEGMARPWKGILLFGPPGTGKTLLAKAVATECKTTFFNISASSVVSKWRGDSEKLVRMLFDLAVHYSPSTVFIDEIDSIMSARGGEGEHEGSRRMKTELLTQMDGLAKRKGGEVVFVLAASNVPWDLDTAMLRRLEKRILVTLPTHHARELIFRKILGPKVMNENTFDWSACAEKTEGMSAADVDIVCREAMMRPIRKMIEKLESFKGSNASQIAKKELEQMRLSAESKVSLEDVEASIAATKSSVRLEDLKIYDEWAKNYGSGMSA